MGLETIVQALGLGRWASTPLRGVFAGMLVTGLVQSSSAVTVATIGFVATVLTQSSSAAIAVLKATPAAKRLAIGQIAFNVVTGLVALALLPLADRLATLLARLFRSEADELARPQHLDATLAATPALRQPATCRELPRSRRAAPRCGHATPRSRT